MTVQVQYMAANFYLQTWRINADFVPAGDPASPTSTLSMAKITPFFMNYESIIGIFLKLFLLPLFYMIPKIFWQNNILSAKKIIIEFLR
jgi:hypothetical protein